MKYFNKGYFKGPLINKKGAILFHDENDEITFYDNITEEQEQKLLDIFNRVRKYIPKKCIVVYRNAVFINDVSYNICLSCGVLLVNNEDKFDLSREERKLIQEILKL